MEVVASGSRQGCRRMPEVVDARHFHGTVRVDPRNASREASRLKHSAPPVALPDLPTLIAGEDVPGGISLSVGKKDSEEREMFAQNERQSGGDVDRPRGLRFGLRRELSSLDLRGALQDHHASSTEIK